MSIKIIKVKSWHDIPVGQQTKGTHAVSNPKTKTIYAVKGKATEADILHERYHIQKKHPTKPRNHCDFVEQELLADLHAYKKSGNPKHILMTLRGIFNETHDVYPNLSGKAIFNAIKSGMSKSYIPNTWKDDFKQFTKEFVKVYR